MGKYRSIRLLTGSDAYKLDHRRQYKLSGNVTRVYSNYTNRKSRIPGVTKAVHFGLQAFLYQLQEEASAFFSDTTWGVVAKYRDRLTKVLGPDAAEAIGIDHIRDLHELGYLPLEFRSLPEGTLVPIGIPLLTVENTYPDFFWLTNYIETSLSNRLWLPSTSATIAHTYRKRLELAAIRTGAPIEAVDWQCHDFSYRGMSSRESAAASGAGHLLSFTGTDTLPALDYIDDYYDFDLDGYTAGSVAATEHSVMSTGILSKISLGDKLSSEINLFNDLLDLYPTGILSVVSDTFDLWKVLTEALPYLKNKIMARDGKLVIRPDSGDPVKILCGDPFAETPHERAGVVQLLWDVFGGTVNSKGFKELDPHIGAIYGDSITYDRAGEIVDRLADKGFASTNVVLGIGSFTYQYNTRDTLGSAMKATWAEVDGRGVDLLKDPITDDGTKRSATGRLAVFRDHGELVLVQKATPEQEGGSLLQPVWRNGHFTRVESFKTIRDRLAEERARELEDA